MLLLVLLLLLVVVVVVVHSIIIIIIIIIVSVIIIIIINIDMNMNMNNDKVERMHALQIRVLAVLAGLRPVLLLAFEPADGLLLSLHRLLPGARGVLDARRPLLSTGPRRPGGRAPPGHEDGRGRGTGRPRPQKFSKLVFLT